nr:hypothetical protein [Aneurinibacillus sp. XH2]
MKEMVKNIIQTGIQSVEKDMKDRDEHFEKVDKRMEEARKRMAERKFRLIK